MALRETLEGLRASLTASFVGPSTPGAGDPVTAVVRPPLDSVQVSSVVTGDLSLTWVTKEVVFDSANVEEVMTAAALNLATVGGQPLANTGSLIPPEGTPGILGMLAGTIPFVSTAEIPINADITWQVLDRNGNPLPADEYSAPGGLFGPEISVVFAPPIAHDLGPAPPPPVIRRIRVTVTLSAGGVSLDPFTLTPDLEVPIPPIVFPTVFAGFRHADFEAANEGAALVVVPEGSPIGALGSLQTLLNTLQATLERLSAIARFGTFLLGLRALNVALTAHRSANVQFREQNYIPNWNDITLIQRPWHSNDTEAEDEISSMILLGRSGTAMDFWIDRNRSGRNFRLTTGQYHLAMIRTLHGADPRAEHGTITGNPVGSGNELSSSEYRLPPPQ